jgi:hypothetical protein
MAFMATFFAFIAFIAGAMMWEEWGRTVRIRCGLNPDQLQRCVCFQVIMYVNAVLTGVNFTKWISHRPGWTKMGSMKNATLLNLRP